MDFNFTNGTNGSDGVTGPQGIAGTNGTNGKNTLVNTTVEPAGSNCVNGGTKMEVGLDTNNNGVLEAGEVNASLTKYVCNGLQGNSSANINHLNQFINNYFDTANGPVTIATLNLLANVPVNIDGIMNDYGSGNSTSKVVFQDIDGNPYYFPVWINNSGGFYLKWGEVSTFPIQKSLIFHSYFIPISDLTLYVKAISGPGIIYASVTQ